MRRGAPPKDDHFHSLISVMEPDEFLVYPLEDPDARVDGNHGQHPLAHRLQLFAQYWGKKFHSHRYGGKLYIIRLS